MLDPENVYTMQSILSDVAKDEQTALAPVNVAKFPASCSAAQWSSLNSPLAPRTERPLASPGSNVFQMPRRCIIPIALLCSDYMFVNAKWNLHRTRLDGPRLCCPSHQARSRTGGRREGPHTRRLRAEQDAISWTYFISMLLYRCG